MSVWLTHEDRLNSARPLAKRWGTLKIYCKWGPTVEDIGQQWSNRVHSDCYGPTGRKWLGFSCSSACVWAQSRWHLSKVQHADSSFQYGEKNRNKNGAVLKEQWKQIVLCSYWKLPKGSSFASNSNWKVKKKSCCLNGLFYSNLFKTSEVHTAVQLAVIFFFILTSILS